MHELSDMVHLVSLGKKLSTFFMPTMLLFLPCSYLVQQCKIKGIVFCLILILAVIIIYIFSE